MIRPKSRPVVERPALKKVQSGTRGLGKREIVRRLAGLGFSHRDEEVITDRALKIVARFLADTRKERCVVTQVRTGEITTWKGQPYRANIEAAHIASRGSFGADIGNVLPLFDLAHGVSHRDVEFWSEAGVDPIVKAKQWGRAWLARNQDDRRWLAEHCNDGDTLALVREAEA